MTIQLQLQCLQPSIVFEVCTRSCASYVPLMKNLAYLDLVFVVKTTYIVEHLYGAGII